MTFKDIAKHLPARLHSGETASIDRMLERLGEELSASTDTPATSRT
jgi:predicted Zn-dependent peptidase